MAVCYSVLSNDEIKSLVKKSYQLDYIQEVIFWCQGVNDTYRLSTDKQRYMLRIYRLGWRSVEQISFEADALSYLNMQMADNPHKYAASPIRLSNTMLKKVKMPEGERYLLLTDWCSGDKLDITSNEQLCCFAQILASLHTDMQYFEHPYQNTRLLTDKNTLKASIELIKPYLKQSAHLSLLEGCEKQIQRCLDQLQSQGASFGFCHGDYQPNNAVFENARVKVFDFDCCGIGYPVYDLACMKWYCLDNGLSLTIWQGFIESYLSKKKITDEEVKAIDDLLLLRVIDVMALHCKTAIAKGWLSPEYFDFFMTRLKNWMQGDFKAEGYYFQ